MDRQQQEQLADRGQVDQLVDFLADDIVFTGDGGGKGRGLPNPVFGRERVARLLRAFFEGYDTIGARFERVQLNGQPGALALDVEGRLINVFSLDITDGAIQTFRSIINPDKLSHLGLPLSDAGHEV